VKRAWPSATSRPRTARSGCAPTAKTAGERRISRWSAAVPAKATLVRVHEPLSLIDLLDTGVTRHSWNLHDAIARLPRGRGVIVLLHRQEAAADLLERVRGRSTSAAPAKIDAAQLRHRRADPARPRRQEDARAGAAAAHAEHGGFRSRGDRLHAAAEKA
jgi:GTP cyclohydrolase II